MAAARREKKAVKDLLIADKALYQQRIADIMPCFIRREKTPACTVTLGCPCGFDIAGERRCEFYGIAWKNNYCR